MSQAPEPPPEAGQAGLDQPGPMLRRGPRPLALHLSLAMLRSSASLSGLPHWNSASSPSAPAPEAIFRALAAGLAGAGAGPGGNETDPAAFAAALGTELFAQDAALIAGIAAYRRHPYRRTLSDPPVLWQEGGTVLRDYAPEGRGLPLLFVPSLINRAYILDLNAERSLLRHLAAAGFRPLLLDWGWPGAVERSFTLTDYVAGRLLRAMGAAVAALGERPVLAGYCMGGTLAVAAAGLAPDLVRALVLLAAPWDFHADDPQRATQLAAMLPLMEPALAFAETLPVDLLQMLFTLLDPFGVGEKYRAFAALDPDSARAALFVALEDWLNDGVPLAAPVAREALGGWYGANSPARGSWRIAGLPVDPSRLALPCFIAAPGRDRIVPPASARPLAGLIAGAVLHEPQAGHIGMVAGSNAPAALWQPLTAWLATLGASRRARPVRRRTTGRKRG